MRLLLDTHAFVWWDILPKRLPSHVHGAMIDPNNTVLLSVASVWEMQIKLQLGKMQLSRPLFDVVQSEQKANRIQLLSVAVEHIWALAPLPWHHKDPFDRLLIAQANEENAVLVSGDSVFSQYPVNILW